MMSVLGATAKGILWLAGGGLAIAAAVVLLLWLGQGAMLFPGRVSRGSLPAALPPGCEELRFDVRGEGPGYGVIALTPGAQSVVLLFGGNGEHVAAMIDDLEGLRSLGVSAAAIDYPGYGGSEGAPGERAIFAAAEAAFDALGARFLEARVIVAGRSLGAAPALHLASTRDVDAVVLLAPFTSMVDAARHHLPWAPVGALLRHRFDNRAAIARTTAHVLIIHNEDDELVPFGMGEELARLAGPRATLVRGAGGGHNAMGMEKGSETLDLVGASLPLLD